MAVRASASRPQLTLSYWLVGTVTLALAAGVLLLVPGRDPAWLTPTEKALVARRTAAEGYPSVEPTLWQSVRSAVRNPKLWLFGICNLCLHFATSYTNYLPTLMKTITPNAVHALLLLVAPYGLILIVVVINGIHADRKVERRVF